MNIHRPHAFVRNREEAYSPHHHLGLIHIFSSRKRFHPNENDATSFTEYVFKMKREKKH